MWWNRNSGCGKIRIQKIYIQSISVNNDRDTETKKYNFLEDNSEYSAAI